MAIYIGADHRGFQLKEFLKNFLKDGGYEVVDMGNSVYDQNDDYPDFAAAVGQKISLESEVSRGVLICGSGAGVAITANKFKNVRANLAVSADQVYQARHDDDINVLCLASDFLNDEGAQKITEVFLMTPFAGDEKYRRRLGKINEIENRG